MEKWYPEVSHHIKGVPIVLVGTKSDLREDGNPEHVTFAQGEQLRKDIKAEKFVECSAKANTGVKNVFDAVIRTCVAVKVPKKPKTKCVIL